MSIDIKRGMDFGGVSRITSLPDAVADQEPATFAQLKSAIEGLNWKDSCRVGTQSNLNLSAPGSTIDGVTMTSGDRVLVRAQSAAAENGIYIWNGAAVAATRSLDMDSAAEVEQAITTVEEGTSAGVNYRQTAVNVTLNTTSLSWSVFGSSSGAASETSAGIAELATQAETDAGTDDARIVTPLKLATSVWASRKYGANFGDGAATSYAITHGLNTYDVNVEVFRNSGNRDTVWCEVQRTSVNQITLVFDTAPTSNQFRVVVKA